MAKHLLNVRVRPARVAILINQNASEGELLLAFEFLSQIWGGRFGQIYAVDPSTCDELTAVRLGQSRPEFIYGIGLDNDYWARHCRLVCQPRGYGQLQPEFVRGLKTPHSEGYILIDHALIHRFKTRATKVMQKPELRLVSADTTAVWRLFCAAMFGVPYSDLQRKYYDQHSVVTEMTTASFIELAAEFVTAWQQSWIDITGIELNTVMAMWDVLAPTVVLVRSRVSDLALFWNLRMTCDADHAAWVIPIPVEDSLKSTVLEMLKDWVLAFLPYGYRPNYCEVTSETVTEGECKIFAKELQAVLSGTPIEVVDYEPPKNRLPVVIPVEYETISNVEIRNRILTIQPPKPKAFETLGSSDVWFVDLAKDIKTGRAVLDLQLPPTESTFEVLNGPCPPSFEHSVVPRVGDGNDCMNIRCSGSKEVVRIYLPTSDEIIGEVLREHGVELFHNEKRSSYTPVIKRFGGLYQAAAAFSGKSRSILMALASGTRTFSQILGTCGLGSGDLPAASAVQWIDTVLAHRSERMKRIAKRRFREHSRSAIPENAHLISLLEHWADRKIVERQWKIGPCRSCKQTYFVPSLDIQQRIICTNCAYRISLRDNVELGYTLHRAVRHAIQEGIMPVALTGRFLQGMTNHGFLWLPGVKYKIGDQPGDIDLLACCDGHLVFSECKTLADTPADATVWDKVVTQFLKTAELAKRCDGSLVVLSALVQEFPDEVSSKIAAELNGQIPYLLLGKQDLEIGYRSKPDHAGIRMVLGDVLRNPFPERPKPKADKPRTINYGWGVHTRG